jgi:hypothetical protein
MLGTIATRFIGINWAVGRVSPSSVQGNTVSAISLNTSSGATTNNGVLCGINVTSRNANIGTLTANTIGAASGVGSLSVVSTKRSTIKRGRHIVRVDEGKSWAGVCHRHSPAFLFQLPITRSRRSAPSVCEGVVVEYAPPGPFKFLGLGANIACCARCYGRWRNVSNNVGKGPRVVITIISLGSWIT